MSKTCNGCGTDKLPTSVPYVVHESAMARAERQNKALVWVIVLLIILLVGSNIGWLVYESSFETVETWQQEVVQDAENGENTFIGGDYIGETKNNN
jgi:hypothetical protein